jgi:excisionase family DNA binding protein
MKNTPVHPDYLSTSQTAKVLGLSVGTVQRMVENGVLEAFHTQGGHRRILSTSLDRYCKLKGFPGISPKTEGPPIWVLHDIAHPTAALEQLAHWPQVMVITHPLDLMNPHTQLTTFFIDARIAWLHNTPLSLQTPWLNNTPLVVYNSDHLPASSPLQRAAKIQRFAGDISSDLVFGYLMGSAAPV